AIHHRDILPFPTRRSSDLLGDPNNPSDHVKAIAFTAGFHFGFIEQGGTSLYATLAQKVSNLEVLRILLSIGGSEIMHFQTWQDRSEEHTSELQSRGHLVCR